MKYTIWVEQDCGGQHFVSGYLTEDGELVDRTEQGAVLLDLDTVAAMLPTLSYDYCSLITCKIEAEE